MNKRLLSSSPRLFSVEAANRTLPLVSAILSDLAPLWESVESTRKRIQHLLDDREIEEGNPYSDELSSMEDQLARDSSKVERLIDELREIGVEFKGGRNCHVCFPAMLEGKLAYLSYQLGELEVNHWMDLDGAFGDRQSLLATAAD